MKAFLIPFVLLSFGLFAAAQVDWFSYLGKSFEDKDVLAQFGQYGEYSSYTYRSDDETQMNWGAKGIAITTNDGGVLQKIYFFNQAYKLGETTFSRCYQKLPFDITLDMKPEEVIAKLGKPSNDEGSTYRSIVYKTNYEYRFLFREGEMQYMQIGFPTK